MFVRNIVILTLELIVLTILLALYYVFSPSNFDVGYLILILGLVLFSIFIFNFRKVDNVLKGNFITITTLFVFSFVIVHFQFYIDFVLGLRDDLSLTYYLDYNIIPKAALISSTSLVAFLMGNLIFILFKRNNIKSIQNYQVQDYSFSFNFLRLLILIFFVMFVFVTPVEYFKGGYHDLMNSGGISYLQYKINHLLQIFIWAYLICYTIKVSKDGVSISILKFIKNLGFSFLTILSLYFLLNLIVGDRGPLVVIVIMLVTGYYISQKKKISFKGAIISIFLAATILQFVAFLRMTDGNLSISDRIDSALITQSERKELKSDNSILPVTTELATSIRAYHAAVMDQESSDILYGRANIGYIISIIPGLGLILQDILGIKFLGTAEYITDIMGAKHGMGTTVLADTYLNYGFYGSVFIFFIFGYFFAKLDSKAYLNFSNSSLISQILFLLFISYAVIMGRSTFIFVLSNFLLVYIVIKISILVKK